MVETCCCSGRGGAAGGAEAAEEEELGGLAALLLLMLLLLLESCDASEAVGESTEEVDPVAGGGCGEGMMTRSAAPHQSCI